MVNTPGVQDPAAQVNAEQVNTAQAVRARRAHRESAADEKASTVGRLRISGASLREISRTTNWPLSTCHKAWERWRRTNARAGTETTKDLLTSRLESLYLSLSAGIRRGDPASIREATRVTQLEADLLGLAPNSKLDVALTGMAPMTVVNTLEFVTYCPRCKYPTDDPMHLADGRQESDLAFEHQWGRDARMPALLTEGAAVGDVRAPVGPGGEEAAQDAP